jgi:D-ribose pyranase
MLKDGIINGQLASLLARFRHVNSLAIVDGPFPSYPNVELVDLAVVRGFPTIPDVLDALLPHLDLSGIYLAREFSEKVDKRTVDQYTAHHRGLPTTVIPHDEFKVKVGQALGIIHTGDPVPYSSVILRSG